MPRRVTLLISIILILAIGVGITSIDSSSIQSDMNNFENQLTNSGIITTINNSSLLGDIANKIQGIIDLILTTLLSFFKKIVNLFT